MRSAYDLYTFPHKQRQREAMAQALAEIEKERKRRAHVAAMKLPDQSESDMEERFYYLSRLGGTGKRIYSVARLGKEVWLVLDEEDDKDGHWFNPETDQILYGTSMLLQYVSIEELSPLPEEEQSGPCILLFQGPQPGEEHIKPYPDLRTAKEAALLYTTRTGHPAGLHMSVGYTALDENGEPKFVNILEK